MMKAAPTSVHLTISNPKSAAPQSVNPHSAIQPSGVIILPQFKPNAVPTFLMRHKLLDIARRVLILLVVVWTVVSLVTILIELVPGDPATAILGDQATPEQLAQFRQKHGLDRPAFFFGFPTNENGRRTFRWYGLDNRYDDYWVAILHG